MAKVAIVTDSNSGITQKQAKEMGIFVLPMPFMIKEETFFEDISLSQKDFYRKLASGADVVTSQPSPESVMKLWDSILTEYDELVHIPMSGGLSGSCQSATMLAEDYAGKVQVVNNLRISVVQRQSVLDARRLADEGKNAARIKEILEADKYNCSIYITLDTLYYLKKGGRITPAAAMLGTVLKIKPVLQIQGDKLDAFAKARTLGQGKTIMINAIKNDMINRFGGADAAHVRLQVAHSENAAEAEILREELAELFPGIEIIIGCLSLSVACHIGPGALAIACTQNLAVDEPERDVAGETLSLVLPTTAHEKMADEYKQEFFDHGEKIICGSALFDQLSFADWLQHTVQYRKQETAGSDWVPATTFFACRKEDDRIIGMIDLRHHIDHPYLKEYAGHIGYSVRPSERCRGYATEMLGLALEYAREIGLEEVMVSCHTDNIGSIKTILKHGGRLTEEKNDADGQPMQVYWIATGTVIPITRTITGMEQNNE